LLRAARAVKPDNLYITENLTKTRSKILYGLRQAKRRFPRKINGCGSQDGRVFVWVTTPDPSAKNTKLFINTLVRFGELCEKTLGVDAADLFDSSQ